jgi:hypothetical protein
VFNVLFVGYSLAKNNLNSTYQYVMPKKNSKTMNYVKFKVSREVSRFFVAVTAFRNTRKKIQKHGIELICIYFSS